MKNSEVAYSIAAQPLSAIGISGSRRVMTPHQRAAVFWLLQILQPDYLHHGDCLGVDLTVARMADQLGIRTVSHPSVGIHFRAFHRSTVILHAEPPLERNRHIVDASELVLFCPFEDHEIIRSGTWTALRYSRKQEVPHILILGEYSAPHDGWTKSS